MFSFIKSSLLKFPCLPTLVNGTWIWFPNSEWGAFRLSYEPEVASELLRFFRESKTFIDIGAHNGLWSVWAAKTRPDLCVIAYEPGGAAETFENFATLNGVRLRVKLHRTCISTAGGFVQFFDSGSTRSGLDKNWAELASNHLVEATSVAAITLDAAIAEVRRKLPADSVITIKCDIEGHEHQVFKDPKIFMDPHLRFVVELHGVDDVRQCEIVCLAKSAGRECRVLGTFWGGTVTVSF